MADDTPRVRAGLSLLVPDARVTADLGRGHPFVLVQARPATDGDGVAMEVVAGGGIESGPAGAREVVGWLREVADLVQAWADAQEHPEGSDCG